MSEVVQVTVAEEQKNERIDKFVAGINNEWSRTQVQQWIKDDVVTVNGKAVKGNYKVRENDEITVTIPEPEELDIQPEDMNLEIYYEDADVLVVNKPRGMVVHPAPGHTSGTLVNGLMHHCTDLSGINGVMRPGIVHRIDKDTSGLLMVAKNDMAHESLVNQLVAKTVTRRYKAIVHGVIPHDKGTIDAPIARDKKERQSMTVDENGKHAVTHFQVLERFKDFTLVECRLETGRTHQIRVHMKYIGYPLAGDPKYGPKKTLDMNGQALHAGILGFDHPRTGEYIQFEAPIPEVFEDALNILRKIVLTNHKKTEILTTVK
ncbi:RluA family pseudouridine synthase [Bacillus cereus]